MNQEQEKFSILNDPILELYKSIVESAGNGIWVIDRDGKSVFMNQRMADFLECDPESTYGKSMYNFMDEEGVQIAKNNLAQGVKQVHRLDEYKLLTTKGKVLWTLINSGPIIKDGVYLGAVAMITDITDQKLERDEQNEIQQRYRSLFEDNPVPTWDEDFSAVKKYIDGLKERGVKDFRKFFKENNNELVKCVAGLVINDVNKAVIELNDAKSKELMLSNYRKLITRKSVEYAIEQCVAIAENRTSCEFDAELKTFSGNKRFVHLKWSVVKGYEHNYKRVYLTTTDLTERIIEENLNLQQSNREKEVLLKEIHHRVKNNLQIIMSLLNLQSRTIEDKAMLDVFEMSLSRIKSMATVHELLYQSNDFSQINYLDYLKMLIYPLVDSMAEDGLEINVKLDVDNINLNINTSIPLGLLITEVVTNSIKHGLKERNGDVYIQIVEENRPDFILKIGDNGVGIPPEFDIESTDSLGLQLVHTLAEQLMGRVRLDRSKPGTHFEIRFQELVQHSLK